MAGANAEYAYGYCAEYAEQLPNWDWIKSRRAYRKKLFKDTHLYVGVGYLTFGGGFSVSTGNAFIQIHNKNFAKIMRQAGLHLRLCHFDICNYYRYVMEIPLEEQSNYVSMVPEITPLYQNSRINYRLLSEFPTVLDHVFKNGKAILDRELDQSSEIALLRSAMVPKSHLNWDKAHFQDNRNLRYQMILRLMLDGDIDFFAKSKENLMRPAYVKEMERIEPFIDEIIANSPYLDVAPPQGAIQ